MDFDTVEAFDFLEGPQGPSAILPMQFATASHEEIQSMVIHIFWCDISAKLTIFLIHTSALHGTCRKRLSYFGY